jgi:hypothetical protein
MRWPPTALLVLILPLRGLAEGTQKGDVQNSLCALLREYESACRGGANRGTDSPLREFPARFLAVAKANPGSPMGCAALGWVIGHGPGGPEAAVNVRPEVNATVEAAIEILTRDHARDEAVGPFCADLVYHVRSRAAEGLLEPRILRRLPRILPL